MRTNPDGLDFDETHDLTSNALVPRPVVLISTIGEKGIFNVAPFGSIARPSVKPPLLGFVISTTGQRRIPMSTLSTRRISW